MMKIQAPADGAGGSGKPWLRTAGDGSRLGDNTKFKKEKVWKGKNYRN